MARDPAQTRALFEKHKPTHVIHLAAIGALAHASPYSLFSAGSVGGVYINMKRNVRPSLVLTVAAYKPPNCS